MKRRFLGLLLCLALCLSGLPLGAMAADDTPDYLALGDSISTGFGLVDPQSEGFTYRIADSLGYTLTNASANGSTAEDVLALLRSGSLDAAIADAELITITCGGNDLMGALYEAIAREHNASYGTDYTGEDVLAAFAGTHETLTKDTFLMTAVSIVTTFAESETFLAALADYETNMNGGVLPYIRSVNADARVILTTQYNPYRHFTGLYRMISDGVDAGAKKLNAVITANAASGSYLAVDVYAAFEAASERLCNPTVEPLELDFHPNAAGHRVIADTIVAGLRSVCGHEAGEDACLYCGQTLLAVSVTAGEGGQAAADRTAAAVGQTVSIHAAAGAGFRFTGWEVVSGEAVLADPDAADTTFVMPEGPVALMARFEIRPLTVSGGSYTYENGLLELTEAGEYVICNTDPALLADETIRVSVPGVRVILAGVNGPVLEAAADTAVILAEGCENALAAASLGGSVIACEAGGHACGDGCGSLTLAALDGGSVTGGSVTVTGTLSGSAVISGGSFAADGGMLAEDAAVTVSPAEGTWIDVRTAGGASLAGAPFAQETDITAMVSGQGWFTCFVHVHGYGVPVFAWAEDYSACTVSYGCAACGAAWTADCAVTAEITEPTCSTEGLATYTAAVTVAGETYTDVVSYVLDTLPHDEDLGTWLPGVDTHWHGCADCDTRLDEMPHRGGLATCVDRAVCDVCGAVYGETDPAMHRGQTEIRDAAEAEEFRDGYTGDTWCLDCGEMIARGQVIPATHVHSYGQWVVTREAAADAEGSREKTCACGHKIVESIPKTGLDPVPDTGDALGLWLCVLVFTAAAMTALAWTPQKHI